MNGKAVDCAGCAYVTLAVWLPDEDSYCPAVRVERSHDGEAWSPAPGAQRTNLHGPRMEFANVRVGDWRYIRAIALGKSSGRVAAYIVPHGGAW